MRKRDKILQKLGFKGKTATIQWQEEGPSPKDKKIKRFHELQHSIVSSIKKVKQMSEIEQTPLTRGISKNAQDIIKRKETIQSEIQSMVDCWKEMNEMYKTESNKKKSKFTKSELDAQQDILKKLNREIHSLNNVNVVGFGGVVGTGASFQKDFPYYSDPVMSDEERRELNAIKEKDAEFDDKLNTIGNLLSNMNVIAHGQKEELKKQERVYEEIDEKITETGFKMGKIQRKLTNTLAKC